MVNYNSFGGDGEKPGKTVLIFSLEKDIGTTLNKYEKVGDK